MCEASIVGMAFGNVKFCVGALHTLALRLLMQHAGVHVFDSKRRARNAIFGFDNIDEHLSAIYNGHCPNRKLC